MAEIIIEIGLFVFNQFIVHTHTFFKFVKVGVRKAQNIINDEIRGKVEK